MNERIDRLTRRVLFQASSALTAGPLGSAAPDTGEKFGPLPEFKYCLEASKGFVGPGGSAKEVTVLQLPVSKSIAGVSMRLTPGGLRELHWHAIAAEWAYMIEGRCRTTVYSPNGQAEIVDFEEGDTWYFPKGHPHSLQGLPPNGAHFVLGFDNGQFSEFGTFSITDWFAQTPPDILAQSTKLPRQVIANLPRKEAYIVQGKVPSAGLPRLRNQAGQLSQSPHKYSLKKQRAVRFEGGDERVVTAADFPIQTTLTAALLRIEPGALRELHWHPNADEWAYVLDGTAQVSIFGAHGRSRTDTFSKGDVYFIDQGFGHYIFNTGTRDLQVLILFNSPLYQNVPLSSWLGANPAQILSENFGISDQAVDAMPDREIGIIKKL